MDDVSAEVVRILNREVRELQERLKATTEDRDAYRQRVEPADFVKVEVKEEELTECSGICLAAQEAARLRAELESVRSAIADSAADHHDEVTELRRSLEKEQAARALVRAAFEMSQAELDKSVAARNHILQEASQQRTKYEDLRRTLTDLVVRINGGEAASSQSVIAQNGRRALDEGVREFGEQSAAWNEDDIRPPLMVDEPPLTLGNEEQAMALLTSCTEKCGIADILIRKSDFIFSSREPDIALFANLSHIKDSNGNWERDPTFGELLEKRRELFILDYDRDDNTFVYAGTYDVTKVFKEPSKIPQRDLAGQSLKHKAFFLHRTVQLTGPAHNPDLGGFPPLVLAAQPTWVEFALLERVGVNAALYHALRRKKEHALRMREEDSGSAAGPDTSRNYDEHEGTSDGERQAKRPRLST